MLPEEKQKRIEHIRQVLQVVHVVPIATISPDDIPHNSPVFMAFDRDFNAIWASHPSTQHSQNILRRNRVFLSVFDSRGEYGNGLFIEGEASVVRPEDPDFQQAFKIFAAAKKAFGAPEPLEQDFALEDGQRLYCAVPKHLWINYATKDERGVIILDQRFRVTVAALKGE